MSRFTVLARSWFLFCVLAPTLVSCAGPRPFPEAPTPETIVTAAAPATSSQVTTSDPSSLVTNHCIVYFVSGHRDDAVLLSRWVTEATDRASGYFSATSASLWQGVTCRVHQMEMPSSLADDDRSTIMDAGTLSDFSADVFVLSLSQHRRLHNITKDEAEQRVDKVITHELSTILLDRATLVKGAGYRFRSAPDWFTQGYEEYFAAFTTTERIKASATTNALRTFRENPDSIRFEGTLSVDDPYVGGLLMLWFLHEKLGDGGMRALLASPSETFAGAFRQAIGKSIPGLGNEFITWVSQKPT